MATKAKRSRLSLRPDAPIIDYRAPQWFERLPRGVGTGGVLVVLLAASSVLRGRYLTGQLWSDEANTVGIATHSLTAIPGVLAHGGGAPLYFLVLHVWMRLFGTGAPAVHALSLLCGLATIPVAMWVGWSLLGRRGGYIAATLFAFNAYLTKYSEEARPYELLTLLALIAIGAFLHTFVLRRRGRLPVFVVALTLMLYTDAWSLFFAAALMLALIPAWITSEDRRGLLIDAAIAFGASAVLYVPWLPTLIHQAASATAPYHYAPLLGANFPRNLLGSDRVDATLALALVIALVPLGMRPARAGRPAMVMWTLVVMVAGSVLLAKLFSIFISTWAARYLGPVAAALLLVVTLGCARSGAVGLVALVLACAFLVDTASFIAPYKSDMREVSGELSGDLRPGDVVFVAQPEQTPLAWYYLPAGLRYVTSLGPDPHPTYMNWDNAYSRLRDANPTVLAPRLVASLRPGQRLIVIRPLTEGELAWAKPWAALVRRRAAQWGELLASNPALAPLPGAVAPGNYPGSCCIANSAVVYVRRS